MKKPKPSKAQTWARKRNWTKGQLMMIKDRTLNKDFTSTLTLSEFELIQDVYYAVKHILSRWEQNNSLSKETYLTKEL